MLELLLKQREDRVPITEHVITAAAENRSKDVVAPLLDRILITENVVRATAKNFELRERYRGSPIVSNSS